MEITKKAGEILQENRGLKNCIDVREVANVYQYLNAGVNLYNKGAKKNIYLQLFLQNARQKKRKFVDVLNDIKLNLFVTKGVK